MSNQPRFQRKARLALWLGLVLLVGVLVGLFYQPSSPQEMRAGFALLVGPAFMVGGLAGFVWGLRVHARKRLMQNTPTSKVGAVALGPAELHGRAVPQGALLTSPILRTPCVYWRYTIEESYRSRLSEYWFTLATEEHRAPFFVSDETGQLLVDADGATIDISQDLRERTGSLSPRTQDFCARQGYGTGFFSRDKRFTEWHIAPDDMIYVFGAVVATKGRTAGLTKTGDRVVRRDRGCSFFYIADKSTKDVERSFARRSALGIVGGGLAALIGLGIQLFSG